MDHDNERQRELRFICPECGLEDTLCGNYLSWIEVDTIYKGGGYDGIDFSNDIVTFSCGECGYVLTDERGITVYEEDLAQWVIKNCPQTEEVESVASEEDCDD